MTEMTETIRWRKFNDETPPRGETVLFRFDSPPEEECLLCRFGEGSRKDAIRMITFGTDLTAFFDPSDLWAPLPKGPGGQGDDGA